MWFPNRFNTNRAVQAQKMARDWKFWIWKVEELYYPKSENKGADPLPSYCEADLPLWFCMQHIVGFLMRRLIVVLCFIVSILLCNSDIGHRTLTFNVYK